MFRALDDHVAYSTNEVSERRHQRATLKKCPANYPDRRLLTHGRIRMGRFFIFIIIVSIALVLGMAFLVTHF
jgi:hypothetical protein